MQQITRYWNMRMIIIEPDPEFSFESVADEWDEYNDGDDDHEDNGQIQFSDTI